MKVAFVVPGSGGAFYCQNCLRDGLWLAALAGQGLDVAAAPLYLPLLSDGGEALEGEPVFFGAVNVYLQEKSLLFRHTPRWIDRLLDSPAVLRWAARLSGSTRASGLGEITASMLRGAEGRQAKELDRFAAWLADEVRPDVVHLSNALLLGLGPRIKKTVRARLVCSLQDEDTWVDVMEPREARAVWDLMARQAAWADGFAASSRFYRAKMIRRLGLGPGRVRVIHPGVDPSAYPARPAPPDEPALGFLSRLCEALGLPVLFRAYLDLARRPAFPSLRLRLAGGSTAEDRPLLRAMRAELAGQGLSGRLEEVRGLDRETRLAFLASLSALSVPVPGGEAFGLPLLEALASGVPVVQPRRGAYPEILERTGGGVLYDPDEPGGLEEALASLLGDPERAAALGREGRRGVARHFHVRDAAAGLADLYADCLAGREGRSPC